MSIRNVLATRVFLRNPLMTLVLGISLLFAYVIPLLVVGDTDGDLVAYYSFNAVSAMQVYDETGLGNDGTLINGTMLNNGLLGSAAQFDGNCDSIYVPSFTGLNPDHITGVQSN